MSRTPRLRMVSSLRSYPALVRAAVAAGGLCAALGAGGIPTALRAATIAVDTLTDTDVDDGLCSLREAIQAANTDLAHFGCPAGSGADRVTIDLTGAIVLTSDLPTITRSLTIAGPATGTLALNGANHRLLFFNGAPNGRTLRVERMTLRNGLNPIGGGCITVRTGDHLEVVDSRITSCESGEAGGGIYGDFAGSITLQRTTLDGNLGALGGGGIYLAGEGFPVAAIEGAEGLEPTAFMRIEDSTVSANTGDGESVGGGIMFAWANGEIRRSTVSGNACGDWGAGVAVIYGSVLIAGSTITGNSADTNLDDTDEVGGGLLSYADALYPSTIELASSVVAGNLGGTQASDLTTGPNSAILSLGGNLIGARDGGAAAFPLGAPNANDDWVGSRAALVIAGLSPLADNGGPTETHAPSPGSLLVDHGDCPDEPRDQRGYGNLDTLQRAVDNPLIPDSTDGCDIGAFETDSVLLPVVLFHDGFASGDTGAWSSSVP
jgi:CSLREA domain-containing protein